ncbi:MAG: hypothetical protein KA100_03565 [Rickettsiales bacterium]|nr:hypothetical protein [Rickettsiales bacterium]
MSRSSTPRAPATAQELEENQGVHEVVSELVSDLSEQTWVDEKAVEHPVDLSGGVFLVNDATADLSEVQGDQFTAGRDEPPELPLEDESSIDGLQTSSAATATEQEKERNLKLKKHFKEQLEILKKKKVRTTKDLFLESTYEGLYECIDDAGDFTADNTGLEIEESGALVGVKKTVNNEILFIGYKTGMWGRPIFGKFEGEKVTSLEGGWNNFGENELAGDKQKILKVQEDLKLKEHFEKQLETVQNKKVKTFEDTELENTYKYLNGKYTDADGFVFDGGDGLKLRETDALFGVYKEVDGKDVFIGYKKGSAREGFGVGRRLPRFGKLEGEKLTRIPGGWSGFDELGSLNIFLKEAEAEIKKRNTENGKKAAAKLEGEELKKYEQVTKALEGLVRNEAEGLGGKGFVFTDDDDSGIRGVTFEVTNDDDTQEKYQIILGIKTTKGFLKDESEFVFGKRAPEEKSGVVDDNQCEGVITKLSGEVLVATPRHSGRITPSKIPPARSTLISRVSSVKVHPEPDLQTTKTSAVKTPEEINKMTVREMMEFVMPDPKHKTEDHLINLTGVLDSEARSIIRRPTEQDEKDATRFFRDHLRAKGNGIFAVLEHQGEKYFLREETKRYRAGGKNWISSGVEGKDNNSILPYKERGTVFERGGVLKGWESRATDLIGKDHIGGFGDNVPKIVEEEFRRMTKAKYRLEEMREKLEELENKKLEELESERRSRKGSQKEGGSHQPRNPQFDALYHCIRNGHFNKMVSPQVELSDSINGLIIGLEYYDKDKRSRQAVRVHPSRGLEVCKLNYTSTEGDVKDNKRYEAINHGAIDYDHVVEMLGIDAQEFKRKVSELEGKASSGGGKKLKFDDTSRTETNPSTSVSPRVSHNVVENESSRKVKASKAFLTAAEECEISIGQAIAIAEVAASHKGINHKNPKEEAQIAQEVNEILGLTKEKEKFDYAKIQHFSKIFQDNAASEGLVSGKVGVRLKDIESIMGNGFIVGVKKDPTEDKVNSFQAAAKTR